MLKTFWERRRDEEEGFTLIELMVVVLIIGILIAIALPTFLGARNRANDKAAQSGLRNAVAAAKTCFTDGDSYLTPTACDDAQLVTIETSLQFVPAATDSTGPTFISVDPASDTLWYGAALSKTDTCFYIADNTTAVTAAGVPPGTQFARVLGSLGVCNAAAPPAAFSLTGWQ